MDCLGRSCLPEYSQQTLLSWGVSVLLYSYLGSIVKPSVINFGLVLPACISLLLRSGRLSRLFSWEGSSIKETRRWFSLKMGERTGERIGDRMVVGFVWMLSLAGYYFRTVLMMFWRHMLRLAELKSFSCLMEGFAVFAVFAGSWNFSLSYWCSASRYFKRSLRQGVDDISDWATCRLSFLTLMSTQHDFTIYSMVYWTSGFFVSGSESINSSPILDLASIFWSIIFF